MHVRDLTLTNFRSYPGASLTLSPGVTTLLGHNGQGKTNIIEAIGYVATLGSHRVASDQPMVRFGEDSAIVRSTVIRDGRESLVELEIIPGKANRARLNRSPAGRQRDVLGTLRTVLFAPEDLALIKGDPGERRRFLDDLLVARQPRWSGVRSDYDKTVKQRTALLRSASHLWRERRSSKKRTPDLPAGMTLEQARDSALATLSVYDDQLAAIGASLTYARLRLIRDLLPYLSEAYRSISDADTPALAHYKSSLHDELAAALANGEVPEIEELRDGILTSIEQVSLQEKERGVTLIGPHRDDLVLALGELPVKGYASHGESWSFALALRLAAFRLLRHDLGTDPVLILDDVFAELDSGRRERLAGMVADCEQVLVTAAVPADVPPELRAGVIFDVTIGSVTQRESVKKAGESA
ncbi:DNA replication/repair protein RecF [Ornithinimicrobium sp. Arc0846-15]|nr:DNA replication/repair protein RecF [Ornithinimicrobium laminariae]